MFNAELKSELIAVERDLQETKDKLRRMKNAHDQLFTVYCKAQLIAFAMKKDIPIDSTMKHEFIIAVDRYDQLI